MAVCIVSFLLHELLKVECGMVRYNFQLYSHEDKSGFPSDSQEGIRNLSFL